VTQTVEVTGEAPLVQTTEAAVGYLMDNRTITELPLNGRDISQLMLLNPGVTQNANGKWGNADKGFGKRFSISGMRGEDNSYLLDGSYINDYYRHVPAGPSGALTGIETVREFQMLTNSFSAAYGRALGGVFNAVTKSGTNQWHGSAYEFLRNSKMDAANFFDNAQGTGKAPLKRNQFGATFGGPVFRDKTFFFVAYEGLRERLSQSSVANVPGDDARRGILPVVNSAGVVTGTRTVTVSPRIQPFLDMLPRPSPTGKTFPTVGTAEYYFVASQPTGENFGQGRIDHQISDSDSLFGRFTGLNANRSTFRELPDRFEVGNLQTRLFTLSETHIFSPTLLSTFRFSYNRVLPATDHAIPPAPPGTISVPSQPDMAAFESIQGVLTGLRNTEGPGTTYITHRFAFHDDINFTRGNHAMQLGGMIERLRYNPYQPFRPYGEWRFPSLADFLQADPDRIRGTPPEFGVFGRGFRQTFIGL
ncbi:MAG: TonB-dependent receptor plug domain-containing protein, partial [Bryobacteraceae bacterium]